MKHLLFLIAIAVCLTGCHSEKTELAKGSFDVDLYEFVDSNLAMSLDSIVANMPDSGMIDCNAYLIRYTDIEPFLSNLSIQSYNYEYYGFDFKPKTAVGACKLNDKLCYIIELQTAQRLFKKTNQTDSVIWETDGSICPCSEQHYWFKIDKRNRCQMLNYMWNELHYSDKQAVRYD